MGGTILDDGRDHLYTVPPQGARTIGLSINHCQSRKKLRRYSVGHLRSYDRRYRRDALARKDLNWSVPDPRLYNEAFTGRARAIPRCSYCLDDDHHFNNCPKNPNRPLLGYFPPMGTWPMPTPPQPMPIPPPREACRRFNEGRCNKQQRCKYLHICTSCGGTHPAIQCAQRQPPGRSRSPPRRNPTAYPGHPAPRF